MKPLFHVLALSAPFLLAGCNAAMWGNILVLGVSVGIFWGTLSLGRTGDASRSRPDASQPPTASRS